MEFKEIFIRSLTPGELRNELLFEIASERVAKTELIRFNIMNKADPIAFNKTVKTAIKYLKSFKAKGIVQFLATPESFLNGKTESQFLINKYPHLVENVPTEDENLFFIYVKL